MAYQSEPLETDCRCVWVMLGPLMTLSPFHNVKMDEKVFLDILIGVIRFATIEFCCEINLTLITSEVSFPFHNLSYEVLHGTNEFFMFELGCIPILRTNGAILNSTVFSNSWFLHIALWEDSFWSWDVKFRGTLPHISDLIDHFLKSDSLHFCFKRKFDISTFEINYIEVV